MKHLLGLAGILLLTACGDEGGGAGTPDGGTGTCAITAGSHTISGGGIAAQCMGSTMMIDRFDGTLTLAADPANPGRFTLDARDTINGLDLDPTPTTITGCRLRATSTSSGGGGTVTATYELDFSGATFTGTATLSLGTACTVSLPVRGARR